MATIEAPPCAEFLHSELLELAEGRAVVRFRPTAQMTNSFGFIQGGILAAMLDNVAAPAILSAAEGQQTSTMQMSVNYFRPVRPGEVLIGMTDDVRLGRISAYAEVHLERESDKALVCKAIYSNVLQAPPSPPQGVQ